jgi:hypothetical protein
MFKCALLLFSLIGSPEKNHPDTVIKWTDGFQLNYADFSGLRGGVKDSTSVYDTLAVINCSIKYEIKIGTGKRLICAYGIMNPQKSWMRIKDPEVLKHEQGHFDICEVYARRFEKTINDTSISDVHDYFLFVTDSFKEVISDLKEEQDKYDAWSQNTPGKEYYYKWITEQLSLPK